MSKDCHSMRSLLVLPVSLPTAVCLVLLLSSLDISVNTGAQDLALRNSHTADLQVRMSVY